MERLHIFLVALFGVVSCSHDWMSGSVLEVRSGDNVTLYCDCKRSVGEYIVWYRNCSHENQPTLVLKVHRERGLLKEEDYVFSLNPKPRFHFVNNDSSDSYDLLIVNTTDSDEGFYYCGTVRQKVEDNGCITSKWVYTYGNITTRIVFNHTQPPQPHYETLQDPGVCWTLLYSLCPASAVLSSLLSSLVVYHLCQKKAKDPQVDQQRLERSHETTVSQDEDVCYAALEIRKASQRPKKNKDQSSDFSTYSAINTSRM